MSEAKGPKYDWVGFSDYVSPKIYDSKSEEYVLWGDANEFYAYLKNLYLNSPTNNACINGILKLCYGSGLLMNSTASRIALAKLISRAELKKALRQFYIYNKLALQVEYEMEEKADKLVRVKGGRIRAFCYPAKNIGIGKRDEDGDISCYYISEDWTKKRGKHKPKKVSAFGYGQDDEEIEIYLYQEQVEDDDYFGPVSYHGGIQYAECEVEAGNYHINHLRNQFATGAILNFNNGVPTPDERSKLIRELRASKEGSSNAGKLFVMFNDGKEAAATLEPYSVPDPHKQYEFIDTLSEKKLMLNHGVTSPLLLGIRDSSGGLGSNANEIRESYEIFCEMTLKPIRESFIDGLEALFLQAKIMDTPVFSDLDIFTKQAQVQMKKEKRESVDDIWIEALQDKGELVTDEWEELSCEPVNDPDEEDNYIKQYSTSPADGKPQDDSTQGDSGLYKIRYRYGPIRNSSDSRVLCKYLEKRARAGVVYRKEEIDQWESDGINGSFAPRGESTYSLWKHKGGAYCHHRWYRVVFFRKRVGGKFTPRSKSSDMENDDKKSVTEARSKGVPEKKLTPKDWADAQTKPIDTPNRGKLN